MVVPEGRGKYFVLHLAVFDPFQEPYYRNSKKNNTSVILKDQCIFITLGLGVGCSIFDVKIHVILHKHYFTDLKVSRRDRRGRTHDALRQKFYQAHALLAKTADSIEKHPIHTEGTGQGTGYHP